MWKLFDLKLEPLEDLLEELPSPPLSSSFDLPFRCQPPPEFLSAAFAEKGRELSGDTKLVPEKEKTAWRLVEYRGDEVRAFEIRRKSDTLRVYQTTFSGFSGNLFDYPIFEMSLPILVEGEEWQLVRDGLDRVFLDRRQRSKWDYFFPPIISRVGLRQCEAIWKWSSRVSIEKKRIPVSEFLSSLWLVLIAVLTLAAIVLDGALLPIGAAAFFLVVLIFQWAGLRNLRKNVEKLRQYIEQYEAEVQRLRQQIPRCPSDQTMDSWLNEELAFLEKEAIDLLRLDEDTILDLSKDINPRRLKGIVIEDWGLIQPKQSAGRETVNKEHLECAIRVGIDGKPRYGVYYVQFIYPTTMQIAVYGCFYDFILRERRGLITDEYFYRNVVSVASQTLEEASVLNPDRLLETTLFRLTVSSGGFIQVALTDERVVDDMNKRFEARRKLRLKRERQLEAELEKKTRAKEMTGRWHETSSLATEQTRRLIEIAESELPATRARGAIGFIRSTVRARAEAGVSRL